MPGERAGILRGGRAPEVRCLAEGHLVAHFVYDIEGTFVLAACLSNTENSTHIGFVLLVFSQLDTQQCVDAYC